MLRRTFLAQAGVTLTLPALGYAQAGKSPQKGAAKDDAASIDDLLEEIRKEHDVPALAGAVIKDGRTAATGAVGVRKDGDDTPVTVGDQFHLGSCTKSMTATLAAMFVEQGKLRWDSTLAGTLPDLAEKMHADYREVTLEQLVQQRTGQPEASNPAAGSFRVLFRDKKLPEEPRAQRRAYAEMILSEKPTDPPGTKFVYSNRNYSLVGVMLETIADTPWEELLTARLLRPLGMKSAGFGAMGTPGKVDQPWQHQLRRKKRVPIEPGPRSDNPASIGPGGTVHCSIGDWAKYIACHVRGEKGDAAGPKGSNLLRPETYERLHTPPKDSDYAGGWFTTRRDWGGKVLMHSGSNLQNWAVAWLSPSRGFAALAATNQGGEAADMACDQVCSRLISRFLRGRKG